MRKNSLEGFDMLTALWLCRMVSIVGNLNMTLFSESSDSGCSQHSTRDKTAAGQQNTCDVQGNQVKQQQQKYCYNYISSYQR